ncbi:MAG: nucleotidyltransferase family protein [Hydrogenophaga sp.]|uniref:nucleotidyltransferase domain-containing protein n=1 Tax=Hydrogenophaga sp. TaxID=1904254 RepID=UPI002ABC7E49|nr:nucleotidyltransferase family protein [Hydrogenophaga sp.]MDZ4100402.1 nucleotidyltransferase family protein [Hydrogenophaga sp.]
MKRDLLSPIWAARDRPELTMRQWTVILGQARQTTLLPRLAHLFIDRGWIEHVPVGPRQHLEGAVTLSDRQQHEVRWEVNCIARTMSEMKTPVVLLKGAAYVMNELPPARGRLFSDIDILVAQDRIDDAENCLLGGGWVCEERDAYNQRYYREWMHEIPPLRHIQRNTFIDLHHTIAPPTSRFRVDGRKLLERVVPVKGYAMLFVLAPVDMVLHSAVHLFQEGEFGHGLRDLLDMNDLLTHFEATPGFWEDLLARADELSLQTPLFHALEHTGRLFGRRVPSELLSRVDTMGSNRLSRAMMSWSLGLALRPMHPSCDEALTGVARWLLYVRSHLLRMPLYLVIPHLVRKAWMRHFPKDVKADVLHQPEA